MAHSVSLIPLPNQLISRVASINFPYERQERNIRLTEILIKEGTRFDDDTWSTSSYCMRGAHMCLRGDSHMHPVSVTR